MAGMFDDLIPGNEPEEKPEASTGMFDDLIPSKELFSSPFLL